MAEYVSKNEVKPYKELFATIIGRVRNDIKKQGITFTYHLVGSAKRNLVVRHHNKGFDCDYQINIMKNKNNLSPQKIKSLFMDRINQHLPSEYTKCKDSTSSITIKKTIQTDSKIEFSYDIVLLHNSSKGTEIIRQDKSNRNEGYFWNLLPDMEGFEVRFKAISGHEAWNRLRNIYLMKKTQKINGRNYEDRKSFQLLNEAVNEVLQIFQ